ncbi:armadillo-type protein [Mycena latifolia]|nr:armadillo-type protein [Mycena latifolia]
MHHPLTRQPTRDSLRSWWSDRNPLGPNLDLHAAAKPLMRFMYRRDALAFIAKKRGTRLSGEDMEAEILWELGRRANSMRDAHAVADPLLLDLVDELLSSPDAEVRKLMCWILAVLARRETTIPAILDGKPCGKLVSLFQDIEVIISATQALYWIAKWPEGTQAVVDADVLNSLAELLEAPNEEVQQWPCELLAELALQEPTMVMGALVSLLRPVGGDLKVIQGAAIILERVATSPDGAETALDLDENLRDCVSGLLGSPDASARQWTCSMLEELADSENTALAGLCGINPYIRDEDSKVIYMALRVLYRLAVSAYGAQAVVDASVLKCVPALLELPDAEVCRWTWKLLEQLARHEITARAAIGQIRSLLWRVAIIWFSNQLLIQLRSGNPTIMQDAAQMLLYRTTRSSAAMGTNVLERVEFQSFGVQKWTCDILGDLARHPMTSRVTVELMVSLLRSGKPRVFKSAAKKLYHIARSSQGAQVAVNANVLEYVLEQVQSRNPWFRKWAWDILELIALHETTARPAVAQILFLCRNGSGTVIRLATQILCQIAESPKGAQALGDANVVDCFVALLKSPNSDSGTLEWTWKMLSTLAHRPPTAMSVLDQLVLILRSLDGAQIVVAANVLDCVGKLLDSLNTAVQVWTCELLTQLVWHESTRDAALRINPCKQLVSLLRPSDLNPAVFQRAARTVARIATSVDGAQAIVEGEMLDCVEELLKLPNTTIAVWTCKILGELARHETFVADILAVKPCEQLVSLLKVTVVPSNSALNHSPVRTTAIFALAQLSKTPDGAAAIAATDFFAHLSHLIEFTDRAVLLQTYTPDNTPIGTIFSGEIAGGGEVYYTRQVHNMNDESTE